MFTVYWTVHEINPQTYVCTGGGVGGGVDDIPLYFFKMWKEKTFSSCSLISSFEEILMCQPCDLIFDIGMTTAQWHVGLVKYRLFDIILYFFKFSCILHSISILYDYALISISFSDFLSNLADRWWRTQWRQMTS